MLAVGRKVVGMPVQGLHHRHCGNQEQAEQNQPAFGWG